MAKFTKLNIGDSVASSGGRAWKKLSAESEEVQDELQGTWELNIASGLDFSYYNNLHSGSLAWEVTYMCGIIWHSKNDAEYDTFRIRRGKTSTNAQYNELNFNYFKVYKKYINLAKDPEWNHGGVFTITSKLSEVANGAELLAWLKANATKTA